MVDALIRSHPLRASLCRTSLREFPLIFEARADCRRVSVSERDCRVEEKVFGDISDPFLYSAE